SITGIWMSISTRSKSAGPARSRATAASPLLHSVTVAPSDSRIRRATSRLISLSSTTSTRTPGSRAIPVAGRAPAGSRPRPQRAELLRGARRRGSHHRGHPELAADAGRAVHAGAAAHLLGEPPHDRQPEPGAAEPPRGRRIGLGERHEQLVLQRLRDADAGVAHREPQRRAIAVERHARRVELDVTVLGELGG